MKTNPNDTAFPTATNEWAPTTGLTIRQYYAGVAMQGLLASITLSDIPMSAKVQLAVEFADELINELNK